MYSYNQNYVNEFENTKIGNESMINVNINSAKQKPFINPNEIQSNNDVQIKKSKQTKRSKAMFSKEEDKKLIKAVRTFGENNWKIVSLYVENRTVRQCRERWKKFLCPSLNRSSWTREEDEILLEKYKEYGPKWSQISKYFQHRTDINIKTRFSVLTRKIRKEQEFFKQSQNILPTKFNKSIQTSDISILNYE